MHRQLDETPVDNENAPGGNNHLMAALLSRKKLMGERESDNIVKLNVFQWCALLNLRRFINEFSNFTARTERLMESFSNESCFQLSSPLQWNWLSSHGRHKSWQIELDVFYYCYSFLDLKYDSVSSDVSEAKKWKKERRDVESR